MKRPWTGHMSHRLSMPFSDPPPTVQTEFHDVPCGEREGRSNSDSGSQMMEPDLLGF